MYLYSQRSLDNLATAHPLWTDIMTYVLEELGIDHSIICGHRGKEAQNQALADKVTTLAWPFSKHNQLPSLAIDAVPYPILWHHSNTRTRAKYTQEMIRFVTIVQMVAKFKFGVTVRVGLDWDRDWSLMDNKFNDYPHMELVL
jgi:peptidoglycan L-alanyl-D-glutamate endopeptidase CwlK